MKKQVAIIGLWHLGSVNAVGFCNKNYSVIGIETNIELCNQFNNGIPAIYEPGLKEAFNLYLSNGDLKFKNSFEYIKESDYVVIAFDTPINDQDEIDISSIINAANNMAIYLQPNVPVIITSQVPLGTCEKIEKNIKKSPKTSILQKNHQNRLFL